MCKIQFIPPQISNHPSFSIGANFLVRGKGEWYLPGLNISPENDNAEVLGKEPAISGQGVDLLTSLKLPFSYEA